MWRKVLPPIPKSKMQHDSSVNDKDKASEHGGVAAPALPSGETQPVKPAPAGKPDAAQQLANAQTDIEKRMSTFERSTLRWTRAMFVVFLATGVFIALQWREIRTSSVDTHDLAESAKAQAKAAESFSRTADRSDAKIGQAEQDFRTMADSSKKSIETTQAAMRLDQRAWVGLKYIHLDAPEAEKEVIVDVALSNSGRTLANKVVGYSVLALSESKALLKFPAPLGEDTESVGIFWPGLEFVIYASGTAESSPHNFSLTKTGLEQINNGRLFLFVYGTYTYQDVFGASHITEFCGRYSAKSKHFETCSNHNHAD